MDPVPISVESAAPTRGSLLTALRRGELQGAQLIARADSDASVGDLYVREFLSAIPAFTAANSSTLMKRLGLAETRRLRSLTRRQQSVLTAAVSAAESLTR
ncbi:hypothetical protein [Streptomyces sp. N35]|uniref:hypothetical protein n=1 Tax=Streptomyces sp. N35 TaxID=2795730 RepID=UPI0035AC28AB